VICTCKAAHEYVNEPWHIQGMAVCSSGHEYSRVHLHANEMPLAWSHAAA
jgi:hypothetical protein